MTTNKNLISIGTNCDIAYNIKKHFNVETNFFDWARTQFDSLLYILKLKNIKELFRIDNIDIDLISGEVHNELSITFKNFNEKKLTFLLHHDIKIDEYKKSDQNGKIKLLNEFIDKYERRFIRFLSHIKNNDKTNIFIYKVTIKEWFNENKHIEEFDKVIKSINPNAKYKLIILVYEWTDNFIQKKINNNCYKININKFIDKNIKADWYTPEIKWLEIFNIINSI